jgi:transcriptional/translational regulatory protein YebC/TACO1
MVSSTSVELTAADQARAVLKVMDALEDLDDVGDVYANFDIPDSLMQELGSAD